MNGAEYLCNILEYYGVTHIFGLFGDIQTDFAHAVRKSRIKWIGVHNEKSGGFMADIYARVKGEPGVIFSTLGPGGTNLTSALANATQDRSPLIAISDQVSQSDFRLQSHQYVDFTRAFHPTTGITKQTYLVKSADELSWIFPEAYAKSMEEPRGAVHISIPMDILGSSVAKMRKKLKNTAAKPVLPKSTASRETLKKIFSAERPGLVIVGGSVERSGTEKEFLRIVERFQLPVLTTFRGKNAIPTDHPMCLGTISRHLGDMVKEVLQNVSSLILIGYDYNEGVKPTLWSGQAKTVINVDMYDNRVESIFSPPSLFGDLSKIFRDLRKIDPPSYRVPFPFQEVKNRVKKTVVEALDVSRSDLHPGRIIDAVNTLYARDSIIVCDVGLNKYYAGLLLKASQSNRILFSNGQSSMAFSSGAMGAKLADPQKSVVALVGDGGFLMDLQEILTAVHYKQQITWIIFNNGGLGLIEQAQKEKSPNTYGVKFSKVFFTKLAESFGLYGIRLEPGMSLLPILTAVKKMKKPAIIDVPVIYTPRRKSYRE